VSDLDDGDDGLIAEEVGEWVQDKHRILTRYLDYQAGPRARFLGPRRGGATYIDLFCGCGRAQIRGTNTFVEGSPIVAWNASVAQGKPFTAVYVADRDSVRRAACVERLERLRAPVVEIRGHALDAAQAVVAQLDQGGLNGLHFAFIDPYSLGALNLELLRTLAQRPRMDILVHLSAMDLFRNFEQNLAGEQSEFDPFAPGWRDQVPHRSTREVCRRAAFDHWKKLVVATGMSPCAEMKVVKNKVNRDLYWLLLLSKHPLAEKFWKAVLQFDAPQRGFAEF
jgi:three-Cys-motif partner protein